MAGSALRWAMAVMALSALWGCSGSTETETTTPDPPGPLVWQDEQRLTQSAGQSLVTYNFSRAIAADEVGRVHAVYYDNREGLDHVYYARSLDGGQSWEAEQRLSAAIGGEHPCIAVEDDTVYVSWHDEFTPGMPPEPRVLVRRSTDGGASWEPEVVLADPPQGAAHRAIAASGEHVHVAWGDHRHGATEIYLASSYDRGQSWQAPQLISETPYESWVPTVEADGELVLVGWVDHRDANEEEYLRRSTDAGQTFGPITRLTDDEHDSWAPSIAIQQDTVHFFWFDRRDAGLTDTDVENAIDDVMVLVGLTPEAAPPRDPAVYYLHPFMARVGAKHDMVAAQVPTFQANGGDMMQLQSMLDAFYSAMNQWQFGWELYHKRSTDDGLTFGPDTRLTFAEERSMRPSVAVRGDEVHLAWFDGRDAGDEHDNVETYYRRSLDRGESWQDEVRITNAPGLSVHVSLAAAQSGVHLLWHDDRNGTPDIYYRRAVETQ